MSFFDRQPAMFDVKKRLGQTVEKASDEGKPSMAGQSDRGLADSWVELAPSRSSFSSAELVEKDNGETSYSQYSRQSPVSLQSPNVEIESNLEKVKYQLVKDMLPPGKNTDWIWDWSSRPEATPPNRVLQKNVDQINSTLTTPPNSPVPELMTIATSACHHKAPEKSVFLRFEVIVGLVVSNIMTFMLGATLGFCFCKKMYKYHSN